MTTVKTSVKVLQERVWDGKPIRDAVSLCVRRNCPNKATVWNLIKRNGLNEYDAMCELHDNKERFKS